MKQLAINLLIILKKTTSWLFLIMCLYTPRMRVKSMENLSGKIITQQWIAGNLSGFHYITKLLKRMKLMWHTVYKHFSNHKLIVLACVVILAYLMPYYVLGENTHIRVHDNLDSNIVWYKMLTESGMIFAAPDAALPNVINGLPRSALPSAFDGVVWLYVLFSPFTAYTINQTMMRFVAFFGMYILLKKNILRGEKAPVISVGVALAFALLPFWQSGALSFAGMPLALHIFLTIRKQGKATSKLYWLLLAIIPFFSNFILTFIFFLGAIGLLWLVDWIRLKQFNAPFFFSIAGMTLIYLLKNYMLLYSMF